MNTKIKQSETLTVYDVILNELRGLKDEVHNLRSTVNETRQEIKDTRRELNDTRRELNDRMNHIETEMRSSMRHAQILVVSIVGIAIAVIYSVLR